VKSLLIRTDASVQIGPGHLMRCLALAQAWQNAGGRVIFLMATEVSALESRLHSEGMEVVHLPVQPGSTEDAIQTSDYAHRVGADWVVVDGYHFGTDYQRTIKRSGLSLLFIDDSGHAGYYFADLVLNQNVHAHEDLYQNKEPYTRMLLGTRYVLLRREFLKWRGWKREIPEVARRVLVTMGGSDPGNVTLEVIQALQHVDVNGLEAVVVVGGSNPHYAELQSAVQTSRLSIRLESNVTDMPALMAWADVAVSAGGSTNWELAFMGLPALVLILASNQRPIAERLDMVRMAVNLGWYSDASPMKIAQVLTQLLKDSKTRAKMSQCGQQLVDGEGIVRVLMHIRGDKLRLRYARESDCKLLWEWANDRETRKLSFSPDPIPWEEHVQWFTRKLLEPSCLFFIAVDREDTPVGQVRFDIDRDGKAEISVSVDRDKRGLGYGALLISKAVKEVFHLTCIRSVHAFIKPNNEASIRAFERSGFKRLNIENVRGNVAVHYIRVRGDE
jgi:UDP-2,4-diacetamido-2,4,6-trideoxy-beta-L-altropyranose hydrolase